MEKSLDESMSGDTKDLTKVQSWEEIKSAISTHLDNDADKLVQLEDLVRDCRKARSSSKDRQNRRKVPPPIVSKEWLELEKESKFKNRLMRKFQRSHQNMSSQLKLCLLSFAIFPENSIIKKRSLIYWWIGQDLVSQKGNQTAEQEGEEIYNELLKQGLIEPDDNDPSPLMNRCKMHPLIRYMLISVAEEAGFFYFKSKDETSPEVLPKCSLSSSCLRLIVGGEDRRQDQELAKDDEVSTVFNVNQNYLSLQPHWLLNMKKLAVLQLGRWLHSPNYHIEVDDQRFLNDLGVHHEHLKFLSLRGISRITALPDSIVKLVSLEILDLRACHNLEKLPEDIASLKKLTHLDVSECYLIEYMPKGIEKLSSLQVLKGFIIGTVRKNPCKISDLRNLTNLRRLSIYIGRGAATTGAEAASLKDVASLCSLTISWGVTSLAPHARVSVDWDFPRQLEKLELIGMPEERMLDWKNVKKLYIIGGKVASLDLPRQIDRSSVEILRLKHLQRLSIRNTEEVLKKFPQLVYFEMRNCADEDILWDKRKEIKRGL